MTGTGSLRRATNGQGILPGNLPGDRILRCAVLIAAAIVFVGRTAAACPACAGREDGGPGLFAVYAAMVLTPFVATAVVIRLVRRMSSGADTLAGDGGQGKGAAR